MCRAHNFPAQILDQMINDGTSITESRRIGLAVMTAMRGEQKPIGSVEFDSMDQWGRLAEIGMNRREASEFNLTRAITAMMSGNWKQAGLERAACEAQARALGKDSPGLFIPTDVLTRGNWGQSQNQRAIYQVGTASQGGNIVATDLLANNFIEALRNQAQVLSAGATILTGLVGNVDVPRQASVTNTYWVTESQAITEAEATFDKISMKPKTIGALSKMSRNMLLQSTPAIEMLIRSDLVAQLALGIDLAAISGSGLSGQPTGIVNTAGISTIAGGTNGAPVLIDHLLALESALNAANAPMGSRAYLFNAKTTAALKALTSSTGQYLWTTDAPGQRSGTPGSVNGYPALVTNQLRSNLTKGTASGICSELVLGAWSDLVFGEWGTLEVVVNPYDSTGFPAGDVLIRAMQSVDIGVRHPASFAIMSDALTS
jgi:HK97 family phage major capsid protein